MSEWKQPHIVERKRLTWPWLRIAARLLPVALTAVVVLVLWGVFDFSWAVIFFLPHVASVAFVVVRGLWKGEDGSASEELRVDVSPYTARVRTQSALRDLPGIRDLELIGGESLRGHTRGHVLTIKISSAGDRAAVRIECRPRLLSFLERSTSADLVARVAQAVAPATQAPLAPSRRRSLPLVLRRALRGLPGGASRQAPI